MRSKAYRDARLDQNSFVGDIWSRSSRWPGDERKGVNIGIWVVEVGKDLRLTSG